LRRVENTCSTCRLRDGCINKQHAPICYNDQPTRLCRVLNFERVSGGTFTGTLTLKVFVIVAILNSSDSDTLFTRQFVTSFSPTRCRRLYAMVMSVSLSVLSFVCLSVVCGCTKGVPLVNSPVKNSSGEICPWFV